MTSSTRRPSKPPHCRGRTRAGQPCAAHAGPSGWCAFHDPALGRRRAAGRKRGGQRSRTLSVADPARVALPIRDHAGVLSLLDVATEDTLAQPNSAQRTRAIVALGLAYFKGMEIGEIEQRLEALEKTLPAKDSGDA